MGYGETAGRDAGEERPVTKNQSMSENINNQDVVWVELSSLSPWERNARKHTSESTAKLAAGIRRFGFAVPITAWQSERRIAAGHGRRFAIEALLAEDPKFVPRNAPPGTPPGHVPVMWTEFASEQQFEAFALSDNRQAKNAHDDESLIAQVLRDLETQGIDFDGMGFDDSEIEDLLGALEAENNAVEGSEADDDIPALDEACDSQSGQVYELGPHRLVCGDSTQSATWDLLLNGDEHAPRMLWSDPPYGVAYVGKTKDALTIENDALDEAGLANLLRGSLGNALQRCAPGSAWYVASPGGLLFSVFGSVLKDMEIWRHTLIWAKDRFVLGRCDYHYRHEPIFYGWTPGAAHYWCGDRTQDSVIEVARPARNAEHPTMKPVELVRRHIENSSKGQWIVVDPFGGSGTTLIASASAGRVCRTIELDPRYCDVIRRRWTRWAVENNIDPGSGALAPIQSE